MHAIINNQIELSNMSKNVRKGICKSLTLQNPVYIENKKRGRYNGKTPASIKCFKSTPDGLIVPRGAGLIKDVCRQYNEPISFDDCRVELEPVEFKFNGKLKPFQENAIAHMTRDNGVLVAPTGSGKTVMALALIAKRQQPTLIVVHTKELLNQWVERIETFLDIPVSEIGIIGAGKKILGEKITVGMVQTLCKCKADYTTCFGHVIIDECHRTPSKIFSDVISCFPTKYLTGLTATPWRRDKLHKLIFLYIGDVLHEVPREQLVKNNDILPVEVIQKQTNFTSTLNASLEYSKVISKLTEDHERNSLIAEDVAREVKRNSGIPLVLSDRKNHCDLLKECLLEDHGIDADVLTGSTKKKERFDITEKLTTSKVKVLIATGQLIGEGYDCKGLSSLFITTPVKFKGRLIQYLGRILRTAPNKKVGRLFDYVDENVGVLKASANARKKVYSSLNN